jgi:hypothetical protein
LFAAVLHRTIAHIYANRDRIAPALGKIASGLYIATARLPDGPFGMLCSFVEQAGLSRR